MSGKQPELKPCPFCGMGGLHLELRETWALAEYFHFVACAFCKSHGPVDRTEAAAIARWNARPWAVAADAQWQAERTEEERRAQAVDKIMDDHWHL